MSSYEDIAAKILGSRYAVALTGAGISVESGIPDFRSAGGLWSRFDPMEFGHIESFRTDPAKVWRMLREMADLLRGAAPNAAHYALFELERRGLLKMVITQNVDSLHQLAGSKEVVEFHGHGRSLRCDRCNKQFDGGDVALDRLPPRCSCGGPLRPNFVFFGEPIPPEAQYKALDAARRCDLMLVVGTSASVAPASQLPITAKEHGAFLVEINPRKTDLSHLLSDLHIAEPAGQALPAIVAALRELSVAEAGR
jgi:NAD-dependent deacetylase